MIAGKQDHHHAFENQAVALATEPSMDLKI